MTQIRIGGAESALPEAEEAARAEGLAAGPERAGGRAGRGGARAQASAAKALRKAAADVDTHGDPGEAAPSRDSGVESAHLSASPQDLSLLVNQLYAQIKRELMIERERRGGLY